MKQNQYPLCVACKACKSIFVVPTFWFLFRNCWENSIHLFLWEQFPKFWGPHYIQRVYRKLLILSEIVLLFCLCKNINHSFMRLSIFYLKHLYSKTLDVSIMNIDWLISFQEFFLKFVKEFVVPLIILRKLKGFDEKNIHPQKISKRLNKTGKMRR